MGKLETPLEWNEYVKPMRLAEKGEEPAGGTVCINSGWGSTSTGNFPSMPAKLQYGELPIVEREKCQDNYSGINNVDSGRPLVCPDANGDWYLAGIVSWGMIPCGQAGYPGVFTNVGFFRDWIDTHMAM